MKFPLRMVAAIAILLSSLACGQLSLSPDQPSEASISADDEADEEETVEEVEPTVPPEPTATPLPTSTPAPTATPEPSHITAENVDDIRLLNSMVPESGQQTAITAVAYSPTAEEVASYGWSADVNVWDVETGNIVTTYEGHSAYGLGLEYSPDGSMLASGGGNDYRVLMWDTTDDSTLYSFVANTWVRRTRFSPDGSILAVAGNSNSNVLLMNAESGVVEDELSVSGVQLYSVAISPDGRYVAAADSQNNISVWELDSLGRVTDLTYDRTYGPSSDLEFSPDSGTLSAFTSSGTLLQWNTGDWNKTNELPITEIELGFDITYTQNGSAIIVVGQGPLIIIDAETGSRLYSRDFDVTLWSVSLNGDGSRFAVGTDDGAIHVLGLD